MKTKQAITFTLALFLSTHFVTVQWFGKSVPLSFFMIWITAIWTAIDSSRIQLRHYKSGISYGPIVLFVCILLLWIVAFPWYLIIRHKIKTGTAILKDKPLNVAA